MSGQKKKVMAGMILVVLALAAALAITRTSVDSFVKNRADELRTVAWLAIMGEDVSPYIDTPIRDIRYYDGEVPIVEFSYAASLSVPYRGFYYSPEDRPVGFQGANVELVATEGGWSWQDEGNNRGFTRKILPGWYYYEAWL